MKLQLDYATSSGLHNHLLPVFLERLADEVRGEGLNVDFE